MDRGKERCPSGGGNSGRILNPSTGSEQPHIRSGVRSILAIFIVQRSKNRVGIINGATRRRRARVITTQQQRKSSVSSALKGCLGHQPRKITPAAWCAMKRCTRRPEQTARRSAREARAVELDTAAIDRVGSGGLHSVVIEAALHGAGGTAHAPRRLRQGRWPERQQASVFSNLTSS